MVDPLKRALGLVLASLSFAVPASASYHTTSPLAEIFSETFLPQGAQLAGIQGLLYGVILPFVIVFTLIYVGMRQLDALGKRETQVLSLTIALFLIPSGGYRIVSEFFLALFGLGAGGFGVPGVTGSVEISWLSGLTQVQRCGVMSLIVGGVAALILNAGPAKDQDGNGNGKDMWKIFGKRGIHLGEILIILVFMSATWLTTCGPGPLITAIGWLLVFLVGYKLLSAYYVAGGGGLPALLSLVGLLVIAILLRSQELLPDAIQNLGNLILTATVGIILLIIIAMLLNTAISAKLSP